MGCAVVSCHQCGDDEESSAARFTWFSNFDGLSAGDHVTTCIASECRFSPTDLDRLTFPFSDWNRTRTHVSVSRSYVSSVQAGY